VNLFEWRRKKKQEKMGEGHLKVEGTVHAFCLPLIRCEKLKYEVHKI